LGEAKFFERALKHGDGEFLLGRGQGLTREQVAAGEVGDRERVAVAAVAEHELALVVGAPEGVRFGGAAERGALSAKAPAAAPLDEAVPVEDGVDSADGRPLWQLRPLPELFADLRRAPARILALEPDDHRLDSVPADDWLGETAGGYDR
jgi:hypothetical protein